MTCDQALTACLLLCVVGTTIPHEHLVVGVVVSIGFIVTVLVMVVICGRVKRLRERQARERRMVTSGGHNMTVPPGPPPYVVYNPGSPPGSAPVLSSPAFDNPAYSGTSGVVPSPPPYQEKSTEQFNPPPYSENVYDEVNDININK